MQMTRETKEQFEREEQAYWAQRDELLTLYPGKWVAVVGGKIVTVGDDMFLVAGEAWSKTK